MDGQGGAALGYIKRASRDFTPEKVYRMWGEALCHLHLLLDVDHSTPESYVQCRDDDAMSHLATDSTPIMRLYSSR